MLFSLILFDMVCASRQNHVRGKGDASKYIQHLGHVHDGTALVRPPWQDPMFDEIREHGVHRQAVPSRTLEVFGFPPSLHPRLREDFDHTLLRASTDRPIPFRDERVEGIENPFHTSEPQGFKEDVDDCVEHACYEESVLRVVAVL